MESGSGLANPAMTLPRTLAPLLALGLFAALVPVRLPEAGRGASNGECLGLADRAGVQDLPLLERCAALYPTDVELAGDLGDAYGAVGRTDRAEAAYRQALSIDPDYAELRLRLGRLLLRRGDAAGALAEAERGLEVQPNRGEFLLLRSQAGSLAEERP